MRTTFALAFAVLLVSGCDGCDDPAAGDGGLFDGQINDGPTADVNPNCVDNGGACATGSDCCSSNCNGSTCEPEGCLDQGFACTSGAECCSGLCGATGVCEVNPECNLLGEACTANSDCCSYICNDASGNPCTTSGCSCAPTTGCAEGGAPCTSDLQCCNQLCDDTTGTCALLGACATAGEPCGTPGYNGSCCSTVCLLDPDGVARCVYLGGCRVQDDLCSYDAECCSGVCEQDGVMADGTPILRCANADSCLPVGEVCGGGGSSANCCPNGGGDFGCEPTGSGFSRCYGGAPGCVLPGQECTTTAECCTDPYPTITCTETSRGQICCLADGELCAFGDICCGGICSPSTDPADPPGTLRCGSSCLPDASACTTDSDCCNCCRSNVCTSDCGTCAGPNLGEPCIPGGDPCCDAPAVICNPDPTIEFPTCILAP